MKITSKIHYKFELELTKEQKEAFRIVEVSIDDCNDSDKIITRHELEEIYAILETMLDASSFRGIEDTNRE